MNICEDGDTQEARAKYYTCGEWKRDGRKEG